MFRVTHAFIIAESEHLSGFSGLATEVAALLYSDLAPFFGALPRALDKALRFFLNKRVPYFCACM